MHCHFNDQVTSTQLREAANASDLLRSASVERNARQLGQGRAYRLSTPIMGGQQGEMALGGKVSFTSTGWNLNELVAVSGAGWKKLLPILDAEGGNPMVSGLQDRLNGSERRDEIALLTTEYIGSDPLWTLSPSAYVEERRGRFRKIPI
jgi:hypothetical protein